MALRDLTLVAGDHGSLTTALVLPAKAGESDQSDTTDLLEPIQRRTHRVSLADYADPGSMMRLDDIETQLPTHVSGDFVFLDTGWSSSGGDDVAPYFCKGVGKYLVRNGAAGVLTDARLDSPDGDTPNYDRLGRNGLRIVERTVGNADPEDVFSTCLVPFPVPIGERVPTHVLVLDV